MQDGTWILHCGTGSHGGHLEVRYRAVRVLSTCRPRTMQVIEENARDDK
jgi:hypothetical protein